MVKTTTCYGINNVLKLHIRVDIQEIPILEQMEKAIRRLEWTGDIFILINDQKGGAYVLHSQIIDKVYVDEV